MCRHSTLPPVLYPWCVPLGPAQALPGWGLDPAPCPLSPVPAPQSTAEQIPSTPRHGPLPARSAWGRRGQCECVSAEPNLPAQHLCSSSKDTLGFMPRTQDSHRHSSVCQALPPAGFFHCCRNFPTPRQPLQRRQSSGWPLEVPQESAVLD